MSGREGTLRFHLSASDGAVPAYWKHDGERFTSKEGKKYRDQLALCSSAGTLKLCSGKTYQLSLTSNQPVYLREGTGRWYTREFDVKGDPVKSKSPQALADYDGEALPTGPGTEPGLGFGPSSPTHSVASNGKGAAGALGQPVSPRGPLGQPASPGWALAEGREAAVASTSSAAGGGVSGGREQYHQLMWADASVDAMRSTFKATLHLDEDMMRPTKSKRRLYLMVTAYVEEFGWVVCPIQVKIYHRADRSALGPFPLKFVQYDFRADSSMRAALVAVNYHRY